MFLCTFIKWLTLRDSEHKVLSFFFSFPGLEIMTKNMSSSLKHLLLSKCNFKIILTLHTLFSRTPERLGNKFSFRFGSIDNFHTWGVRSYISISPFRALVLKHAVDIFTRIYNIFRIEEEGASWSNVTQMKEEGSSTWLQVEFVTECEWKIFTLLKSIAK